MTEDLTGNWLARPGKTRDRFFAKVRIEANGCWRWIAYLDKDGYGRFKFKGKMRAAHTVAHEAHHGPVPPGLVPDHTCRMRNCVNPEHTEAVTQKVNVNRGALKDRSMPVSRAVVDPPSATTPRRKYGPRLPNSERWKTIDPSYLKGKILVASKCHG